MSEKEKIESLRSRAEAFKLMTSSIYGTPDINVQWAMKNIMGFDSKNEIRKFKIDRIYGKDNT